MSIIVQAFNKKNVPANTHLHYFTESMSILRKHVTDIQESFQLTIIGRLGKYITPS